MNDRIIFGWPRISYPIFLSDNIVVLDRFENLNHYDGVSGHCCNLTYEQLVKVGSKGMAIQSICKNDFAEAKRILKNSHTILRNKTDLKHHEEQIVYLNALMDGNVDDMKQALENMLSSRTMGIYRDYFEYHFCAVHISQYLKLAWIKGFEIEINHRLVPMDLMPVEPLDEYDIPYFFLAGYKGDIPPLYAEYLRQKSVEQEPQPAEPRYRLDKMVHQAEVTSDGIKTFHYTSEEELIADDKLFLEEIEANPQVLYSKSNTLLGLYEHRLQHLYHHYFKKGDLTEAKNQAFIANLFLHKKSRYWGYEDLRLGDAYHTFGYLISDHPEMIATYCHLPFPKGSLSVILQSLLLEDEYVKELIIKYLLGNDKDWLSDSLIGLFKKDKDMIKRGILAIADNTEYQEMMLEAQSAYQYFMPEANLFLKVAWRLGMEIEVDHDLVLMPLMPVKPLENYTNPFEFLQDQI